MPTHKAFESAGKRPGLQIWRVEKMDLGEVPAELHGSFYMGDSYIVLHTSRTPSYNVHTWIGTTHARTHARGHQSILHNAPVRRHHLAVRNARSLGFGRAAPRTGSPNSRVHIGLSIETRICSSATRLIANERTEAWVLHRRRAFFPQFSNRTPVDNCCFFKRRDW